MITTETKHAIIADLKRMKDANMYANRQHAKDPINAAVNACIDVVRAHSFPDIEQPRDNLDALRILQNVYMDGRLECDAEPRAVESDDIIRAEARALWVKSYMYWLEYYNNSPSIISGAIDKADHVVRIYLKCIKELNID